MCLPSYPCFLTLVVFGIIQNDTQAKLVPGYMVVARLDRPAEEFSLGVWSVDTLIESGNDDLKDETPFLYDVNSPSGLSTPKLQVYASPFQEDLYAIWLSAHHGSRIITLKYHLSLSSPSLACKGYLTYPGMFYFHGVSYAGYAGGVQSEGNEIYRYEIVDVGNLISSASVRSMRPRGKRKPLSWRVVRNRCPSDDDFCLMCGSRSQKQVPHTVEIARHDSAHRWGRLSAYSGAWTGVVNNCIVLRYYQ